MTFLPPPLDFDQSGHTQPSLRQHGSIYVNRFGYAAANSGEMSHRRRPEQCWRERRTFILWRCIGGGFYSLAIRRKLVVNPREMFWRLLCGRIPFVWAVTSGVVLPYRLTMEVAAALTLFVDVHCRSRKTNLPNLNIVWRRTS